MRGVSDLVMALWALKIANSRARLVDDRHRHAEPLARYHARIVLEALVILAVLWVLVVVVTSGYPS